MQALNVETGLTLHRVSVDSGPPDWDEWILNASLTTARFCQTTHWMAIEKGVNGADGYLLWVASGGRRVAAAAVSLRRPQPPHSVRDIARCLMPGRRNAEVFCFEGPIWCGPPEIGFVALRLLRKGIEGLAHEISADVIRLVPSLPADQGERGGDLDDLVASAWSDYTRVEWATAIVDLTVDEAQLMRNVRQAARKAIRKAREAGLRIEQCSTYADFEREFRPAYNESVLIETGKRRAAREDRRWWECDGGRHYRFFVAKDITGRIHATLGTYSFGGVAKEIMSGRTRAGRESGLPSQDLLHFELFLVHKRLGDTRFDLAGYNPYPRNSKEDGIRRFKQKWGGEQVVTSVLTKRLRARLLPKVLSPYAVFGR